MPIDELEISEEEKAVMLDDGPIEEAPVETPKVEPEVPKQEPLKVESKPEAPKEEPKPQAKSYEDLEKQIKNLNAAITEQRHRDREAQENVKREFLDLKNKLSQPEVKPPDPAEDPLGHQNYQLEQLRKQQDELRNTVHQASQVTEQQKIALHVQTLENNYRAQVKDYDAAYKHFADFRAAELAELGITDPGIIEKHIQKSSYDLSMVALKTGKNPAEVVYNMAKRMGYKAPESPKPADTTVKDTIETIAKGQNATNKLSGGDDVNDEVSANELLKMPAGPDFDKKWAEYWDKHK